MVGGGLLVLGWFSLVLWFVLLMRGFTVDLCLGWFRVVWLVFAWLRFLGWVVVLAVYGCFWGVWGALGCLRGWDCEFAFA